MRLLELDLKESSEIQLHDKEIEFIYRATKSNLFDVDKKPTSFSACKFSCDLKMLYGRRSDESAWAIRIITHGQRVYYADILSAYIVDDDFANKAQGVIDIKINLHERLIIVCGDCKFYKTLNKSGMYDFPFVVSGIDYDTQSINVYPFTPIVLESIDDKLTDYKLFYTKQYVDAFNDTDLELGEIDYEYFIKYYDFFRTLTAVGEDENVLVVPLKKVCKTRNYGSVMLTNSKGDMIVGDLKAEISFKVLDTLKDKEYWSAAAEKFERLKGSQFNDKIMLAELKFPAYCQIEKNLQGKSLASMYIKKDIRNELTRLRRIIVGINDYLDAPQGLANKKLCRQVLDADEFVLNTSYTKTYLETLRRENPQLNQEQLVAIDKVLCMEEHNQNVMLIQGPSGTGKTELIATIIKELLSQEKKILVSSNMHSAIDNMIERVQGEKEVLVKRFTKVQGDAYKEELKQNKINYIRNQVLGKFKVDGVFVDSEKLYEDYQKEASALAEQLKKIEGVVSLEKIQNKRQKIVEKKEEVEKVIASKNSVITTAKKVIDAIDEFICNKNEELSVCDITDLRRLYNNFINDFNILYDGFEGEEFIDDKVNKYIITTKSAIEKTLQNINDKITLFINNEDEIASVNNLLEECLEEVNAREYVLDNVNTILDGVKKNIQLGRNYGDNINPKYFEILENNSRLDSSDRVSKILKSVSIRQSILDMQKQGTFDLDEKIEVLARVFIDLNSYVFSTPLSASSFEQYLSLSDMKKRMSKVFKNKKFKGVSYRDFVTEIDANIEAIVKNDIDKLFDEDKEYLFMGGPLKEEVGELKKVAKGHESHLNKLADKKAKITADASLIRVPFEEGQKEKIILAIQDDVVRICKELDKLDLSIAPLDEEINNAKYQVKQKSLVLTRKKEAIELVLQNIKNALSVIDDKAFFFDYLKELHDLVDNQTNISIDENYIDTMIGLLGDVWTDYDEIFKFEDTRGALAMSTSQVKMYLKGMQEVTGKKFAFDYAIIDTADRCNLSDLIVSLPSISKLILVGDFMQLSTDYTEYEKLAGVEGWIPRVIGSADRWNELNTSRFSLMFESIKEQMEERNLMDYYSVSNVAILKRQYRMNEDIFDLVKDIYAIHHGFELIDDKRYGGKDVLALQIDGEEQIDNDYISKIYNLQEVDFIKDAIKYFVKNIDEYPSIKSIGIVTFYNWQARLIKKAIDGLDPEKTLKKFGVSIQIGTVDKFRDKECDLMLVSCVRSKELGEMSNIRKLNIAFSRAKQKLIVLANFRNIKNITPYYNRTISAEYMKELDAIYKVILPSLCKKCKMENSSSKYNLEQVGKFLKVVNKDE